MLRTAVSSSMAGGAVVVVDDTDVVVVGTVVDGTVVGMLVVTADVTGWLRTSRPAALKSCVADMAASTAAGVARPARTAVLTCCSSCDARRNADVSCTPSPKADVRALALAISVRVVSSHARTASSICASSGLLASTCVASCTAWARLLVNRSIAEARSASSSDAAPCASPLSCPVASPPASTGTDDVTAVVRPASAPLSSPPLLIAIAAMMPATTTAAPPAA